MTVTIFVPDLPEFAPIVHAVRDMAGVTVVAPRHGYWQLRATERVIFSRKALGLRVALWYSMLTGGYCGRITEYSRDTLTIENEEAVA